ncbi:hypothetical protein KWQ_0101575 [Xanthomonas vasicola pv. musacearum NCPPB 4380]|nr:hypothetical protein KWQ_0101575 [Xanthomonas vasicola pv. musacearum NCPPB 4380]
MTGGCPRRGCRLRRGSTALRMLVPSASPQNCSCSARIARHAVRIERSAAAFYVWPQCACSQPL